MDYRNLRGLPHSRTPSLDLRHTRNSSADLNKLFKNDVSLVFGPQQGEYTLNKKLKLLTYETIIFHSFHLGRPPEGANNQGSSQLDCNSLCSLYHVLPSEGLVGMATRIHESAHRVGDREGGDKRQNGHHRWQNGRHILWQSSETVERLRVWNKIEHRHIQPERQGGVSVLHWQSAGGSVADWKNWRLARHDPPLANTGRRANIVV